jgi:hypothetical protein
MERSLALAALLLVIGGCAETQSPTCYKIVESVTTEAGNRMLAVAPCPGKQQNE